MQIINKFTESITGLTKLMAGLLGVGIFAELLFGKFLGNFSVIGNLIDIVGKFGNNGFAGLVAILLVLGFVNQNTSAK